MRRRARWITAASIAALASGAGCVDLFHATDFSVADGGGASAGDAGADLDDFCALSGAEAIDLAQHACAWLSACEGPTGENAAGSCYARAVLAFDCKANPNRPPRGAAHDAWRCLAKAATCDQVHACVFGGPPPRCGTSGSSFSAFGACGATSSSSGTRIDCEDAGGAAGGDPCVLAGRSCVPNGSGDARCSGGAGFACGAGGCDGTQLRACGAANSIPLADGGLGTLDEGEDCALSGAGTCVAGADGAGACLAIGGATCTPSSALRCDQSVAVGCPSGVEERVDCAAFGARCGVSVTGAPLGEGQPWDVTRACVAPTTACTADRCDKQTLVACTHGVATRLDCPGMGLGGCTVRATLDGARPACGAPN